jgi:Protein of unknown function (DUF4058)
MPVHDWTKVDAGTFHSFHNAWITHLMGKFNGGVLPDDHYALSERTLTIRHASGHRIVAFLEILSPGNKDRMTSVQELVKKVDAALMQGIHVTVVDLFPPGRFDPHGIHGAVWARHGIAEYVVPPAQPLTVCSYRAIAPVEAYLEHMALGDPLPEMPLFLDSQTYVYVPLEPAYQAAFQYMPAFLRDVLEGKRASP